MKCSITALTFWLCLGAFSHGAFAAEANQPNVQTFPIARFMLNDEPILLRYSNDTYALSVPLSSRIVMQHALLHLQIVNSIALLKDRSQLVVRLNGSVVGQIALDAERPESTADLRLPVELFRVGYNALTFTVAQHYTYKCEDPAAPELWTQIDTVQSTITFDDEPAKLEPRLSDLDSLFDSKLWGDHALTIFTAAPELTAESLRWGTLISEGAALRLRYVPLQVMSQSGAHAFKPQGSGNFPGLNPSPASDVVLVGTKADLQSIVADPTLAQITGAFLAVYPAPDDPTKLILLISGTTPDEVTRAAQVFAALNFPYPDSSTMTVSKLSEPQLASYSGYRTLGEKGTYEFRQFGFQSTTVQGLTTSSLLNEKHVSGMDLEVVMPPDLYASEDTNVDFELHMAYGAGLRSDSVLNILLNNRFERAIALTTPGGEVFQSYKVSIPLRSFRPGINHIRFVPRMMPSITGDCQAIQTENLVLTLYDDSKIKMPDASHLASLPDLGLLVKTGFPYSADSVASPPEIVLTSADDNTVSAAWTLAAKLAQHDDAIINFDMTTQAAATDRDVIVIGDRRSLSSDWLNGAPLTTGEVTRIPYPVFAEKPMDTTSDNSNLAWRPLETLGTPYSQPGVITGETVPGADGLIMQYRRQGLSTNTVTLITAATPPLLAQRVFFLVQPEIWENVQGDTAVWRDTSDSLVSQRASPTYLVGSIKPSARVSFYASRHPWLMLIGVVIVLCLLAALTLELFRRRRYPHDSR